MQGNRPPGPARGRPVSSTPQPTYSLEDDLALTPTPISRPPPPLPLTDTPNLKPPKSKIRRQLFPRLLPGPGQPLVVPQPQGPLYLPAELFNIRQRALRPQAPMQEVCLPFQEKRKVPQHVQPNLPIVLLPPKPIIRTPMPRPPPTDILQPTLFKAGGNMPLLVPMAGKLAKSLKDARVGIVMELFRDLTMTPETPTPPRPQPAPVALPPPRYAPRETCLAIAKPAVPEVSKPRKQRGLGSQAEYLHARLTANICWELTTKEVTVFVAQQRAKDPVFAQAWAKFVAEKDGSEEKDKESARQSIRSYVRSQHHLTPPKPEPLPPPKVYRQTLTENKSLFFRQHFCPDGQPPKQFSQRELCNSADLDVQRNFGSVVETLLAWAKGKQRNMTREEAQAAAYRAIYQNLRSFVARHTQPEQHQAPVEAQVEAPPRHSPQPTTPALQEQQQPQLGSSTPTRPFQTWLSPTLALPSTSGSSWAEQLALRFSRPCRSHEVREQSPRVWASTRCTSARSFSVSLAH